MHNLADKWLSIPAWNVVPVVLGTISWVDTVFTAPPTSVIWFVAPKLSVRVCFPIYPREGTFVIIVIKTDMVLSSSVWINKALNDLVFIFIFNWGQVSISLLTVVLSPPPASVAFIINVFFSRKGSQDTIWDGDRSKWIANWTSSVIDGVSICLDLSKRVIFKGWNGHWITIGVNLWVKLVFIKFFWPIFFVL